MLSVLTVPFLLLLLLLGQLSLFFLFSALFLSRLLLKPLSSLLVSLLLRLVKGGHNIEVQPGKVHWFFSRRRWSGCCHYSCRLVALQQAVRKTEDEVGIEEPSAHNTGLRGCYGRGKLRGGRSCCAVSGLESFVRLFLLWHLWRAVHVVRLRVAQVLVFGETGRGGRVAHVLVFGVTGRGGRVAHVLVVGVTGRGGRVAHVLVFGVTGRGGRVAPVLVVGVTGRGGRVAHVLVFGVTVRGGRVAHVLVFGVTGRGGRVAHVLVFGVTGRGGRVSHVLVFGETGRGGGVDLPNAKNVVGEFFV